MKETFPGYYSPTDDEFQHLWDNCLFVLDANVLLNLYVYSPSGREDIIAVLKQISGRVWVPHQVALEYHSNRRAKIMQQAAAYASKQTELRATRQNLDQLRSHKEHPFVNVEAIDKIKEPLAEILQELEKREQEQLHLLDADHILHSLTDLLEGRIGCSYGEEKMQEISKQCKTRYENHIPPGYRDKAYECGDLILWLQTIDKAKEENKPIIFVTDEKKGDWWQKEDDKIIGPRPELIHEMKYRAGVSFYMYSADDFLECVPKRIGLPVKPETIDEVRSVREIDEEHIKSAAALLPLGAYLKAMTEAMQFQQVLAESARIPGELLKSMAQAQSARIRDELLTSIAESVRFATEPLKGLRLTPKLGLSAEQLRAMPQAVDQIAAETAESTTSDDSTPSDSESEEEPEVTDEKPDTEDE